MSASAPEQLIHSRFVPIESYEARRGKHYSLLPCRFLSLDSERYVVTNFAGEYVVLTRLLLNKFVTHKLEPGSDIYDTLKSRHFLLDDESTVALDLLATKFRTKQALVSNFTSLHIFVVTLRCDHSCPYCQVSRQSEDRAAFDMTEEMAVKAIDFMFRSPSKVLKVEFQGGETLLNFELIKFIVSIVKMRNEVENREIQFVVATNLSPLTEDHLRFFADHDIYVSTSLDGPKVLHNGNRPRPGGDSYERTVSGIRKVREALGPHKIAALMTTTQESLSQCREIIDEYLKQGFRSIFLRSISPYGFAVKTGFANKYQPGQWLEFYKEGLSYILELNRQGVPFRENYSSIVLRKILTPFPASYVDLQSPAGIGISVIVFNYDGNIYASDESRMLAEMGDYHFRLGNLFQDTYEEVITSEKLLETLGVTMSECVPSCSDCGVQPYCGSDPVYHHRTQGDIVGFKPGSGFCQKNMGVIRHLIQLLEDDPNAVPILKSWA